MNILQALILGIVQGLTEFIPVSSSGHLVIFPTLLNWPAQSITFDIIVHLATLLAVLFFFKRKLTDIIKGLFSKDLTSRLESRRIIINLIIATIPVLIFYLLFNDFIENQFKSLISIALALAIVGILLIKSNLIFNRGEYIKLKELPLKKAILIGSLQALSLIRGTSRSGITILAGGVAGLSKQEATEFAFLLSIPAIGSSLGKILLDFDQINFVDEGPVLVAGFLGAFISGFIAISFLIKFLKTKDLAVFGYYRIILAAFLLLIVFF